MAFTAYILYACDLADRGQNLGPETIRRAEALVRKLNKKAPGAYLVFTGAGFAGKGFELQVKSFGEMIADFLASHGVPREKIIVGMPIWGTRAEMREAFRLILSYTDSAKIRVVHVSSSPHSIRIAYLHSIFARGLKIRDFEVRFSFLGTGWSWEVFWWEFVKLPLEFFPGIKERIKKWRGR